jgi:hypothetical protein
LNFSTERDELEAWAFRFERQVQFAGEIIALASPNAMVRKLEYNPN